MVRLAGVILFSDRPERLIEFYKKVFEREPDWKGGSFTGFRTGTGYFVMGPHDKIHGINTNPERIMINLETDDVHAETTRLMSAGAVEVASPYHPSERPSMTVATLADPDGNFLQVTTPVDY